MAEKYEILDILAQDKSGVVFHAEDRDSGRSVVLRRFFPFGPEGGGLQEGERTVYMNALEKIRDFRHPTLRTIIDGGCDPVDGIPFLVSEWVEGQRLGELLKARPLSPGSTKALLSHALEASKELSQVFGEEAVWVEASPDSVILPMAEGESITFWICPIRWLSSPEQRGGLLPLAKLAEKALHWRGKPVAGTAEGLGSWVKAVRDNPNRWTLDEALQALHEPLTITGPPVAGGGGSGGVPTVAMKTAQKSAPAALPKKKSALPLLIVLFLVTGLAAGGLWYYKTYGPKLPKLTMPGQEEEGTKKAAAPKSALEFGSTSTPETPATPAAEAAKAPDKPSALSQMPDAAAAQAAAQKAATPTPPPAPKAPFTANPANQLVGTVVQVEDSEKGGVVSRYITLNFEGKNSWAVYDVNMKQPGFELGELNQLRGKHVRITGTFRDVGGSRGRALAISKRSQIEEQ